MDNLNAVLVDQQVLGIVNEHSELFETQRDSNKKKALAFVLLTVKCVLDFDLAQAADCLTDGGNDFAVDALYIGDPDDGEFDVYLFQGKYKVNDFSGTANFPANSLQQVIEAVRVLFDPNAEVTLNDRLRPLVEEIRSRVRDGLIPNVRAILSNNGASWTAQGDEFIHHACLPKSQVEFVHFNHDKIVEVLKRTKPVDTTLDLLGTAFVEDFNYRRVLVGKIPVVAIADLFDEFDVRLLERNVRRYLGLQSNRVNSAISETLRSDDKRDEFYFFNNGITAVCEKFSYNALQNRDFKVRVSGLQIVNGGQTCKTIQLTLRDNAGLRDKLSNVAVLIRLYEVDSEAHAFVQDITFATNSQNPVELRDLHANDDIQKQLEIGMKGFGFDYRHKRDDSQSGFGGKVLQSSTTAEAVMAIWRHRPHQSKFMRRELFGRLYDIVFRDLNAPQAILANMIFRFVENERKRPSIVVGKDFLPYSGHYVSMRIGVLLLHQTGLELSRLNHLTFANIQAYWEENNVSLYKEAIADVERVLVELYANRDGLSLQQLSATFRRGDLIDALLR